MQQQLEQILQDQQQTAAGRRIAGITTTNTITTTYKDKCAQLNTSSHGETCEEEASCDKDISTSGGVVGLVRALAAPFTKKAAKGLIKAVAKRAAKGAAIGAAGAGMRYGARKIMKKIRKRRR